ncbi:MAG: DUF3043 domain-containing protein [Geodermatophilaceae bacterium]|nr:DUF3043 domain-containing protein [Geodermatophilaceae bacterium]
MNFRRTSKDVVIEEPVAVDMTKADPRRPAGKGRPTPKRRDGDPRARGPVAPPPTNRREAYRRIKQQNSEKRSVVRESARAGDDAALPARDRGPIRRLVRDIVDTRRSVASAFLPFAVLFLAGYFVPDPRVQQYLVLMWTIFFLLVLADSVSLGLRIRKLVKTRFPGETVKMRGLVFYGIQRSTMIRRWRFPKPALSVNSSL